MTLLEIAYPTEAPARCPFSVTDRDVGHWSILLDGSPSVVGPSLYPPTPTWAGSPTTIVESPGRTTFVFGELYGPERERLKSRMLENRRGTLFDASKINGHCAILSIDDAPTGKRTFTLWTNRFGSVHVYVTRTRGRTLLTSSYREAVRFSARELDWPSIHRYAVQGFFPEDSTHFRDVKVLAPRRRYEWNQSGELLTEEVYWNWPASPDFEGTYHNALEELSFLAQTVCTELCSEGTVAVPISGGLDSRSTLAVLPDSTWQSGRALAFSYGYTDESVEIGIARKLAACRGLPFESYVIEPYLFEHLSQLFESTGGLQDVTQARQEGVVERLSDRCNRVLAAHWGDVWLDSLMPGARGTTQPLERIAVGKVLKPGRDRLLGCFDVEIDPTDALESQIKAELEAYDYITDDDLKLKAWKTDTWSHRWTLSSLRVYQTYLFPRLVFYDTRMTDFLTSLPGHFLAGRRLQIDLIKRQAPDLARVRWQAYDANLYLAAFNDSLLLPVRAVRRLKRFRRPKRTPIRNWEVQFAGADNDQKLAFRLADSQSAIHQFLRPEKVRELLDGLHTAPTREVGYALCQLLTLATVFEEAGL